MRVLVGCWPAYGHLLPMLPLVRAARRAGHDVVVSSGADLAPVLGGLRDRGPGMSGRVLPDSPGASVGAAPHP
jgi:UDP:flavonoid glycosyltransferase YjiC (YdhE family)